MIATRPWFATNARALLATRKQGEKPAGVVAVSLIPNNAQSAINRQVLQVHDDMPIERLSWRMLVNLNVWVLADSQAPIDRVCAVVGRIAQARPATLILRFQHGQDVHDIDLGNGMHVDVPGIAKIHRFTWCPINLTGSKLGAQLRRALSATHPPMATL